MKKVVLAAAILTFGVCSCNQSADWKNAKPFQATCGNNIREFGEACDGTTNLSCTRLDASKNWQAGGAPGCSASCKLTLGTCAESVIVESCGNSVLDSDEPCDGEVFADNSQTCETFFGVGATGKLRCVSCRVSTADCVASSLCGNDQLDAGERCDGSQFGDESCETLAGVGYYGDLSCIGCSTIDTTLCVPGESDCGDGLIGADEACDGDNFGDATCESEMGIGYTGELGCSSDCKSLDTSYCAPISDPGQDFGPNP